MYRNYFLFLIIKSDFFVHVRSAQPSILTEVTIMLDDYFKTNPGFKYLPRLEIEPQPPGPLSDAITIRPWRPHVGIIQYLK